jgi:hypothetical protein
MFMNPGIRRGVARLGLAALLAASAAPTMSAGPAAAAAPHDLFISEYVEGIEGLDKAIELYNGTGSPIDLAAGGYALDIFSNGSTTASRVTLSGVVASGAAFVIAHSSSANLFGIADLLTPGLTFNGNDAVLLLRSGSGIPVDLIGQIGVDPGIAGWGAGEVTTANHTLQRHPFVTVGRIANDTFDPAVEWGSFPGGTFDHLGSHTINSTGPTGASGFVDATITVPTSAACLELSTTSVDFGLVALGAVDAPASPTIGVTNCSGSAGTVYARGTDAVGPSALWGLAGFMPACADEIGTDAYQLRLVGDGSVWLSTENRSLGSVAPGATTNQAAYITTACPGSTGGGTTMTFQILFLATEG